MLMREPSISARLGALSPRDGRMHCVAGDDMDEMTEEEMLQLALQRSLEENREGHT